MLLYHYFGVVFTPTKKARTQVLGNVELNPAALEYLEHGLREEEANVDG